MKTPGVKAVDSSLEARKGEEGEIEGIVIDASGAVYNASQASITKQGAPSEKPVRHASEKKATEKAAVVRHGSLNSIMGEKTLDWDVAMEPEDAVMNDVAKKVNIRDQPEIHHVQAYSTHIPRHPHRIMITRNGIEIVQPKLNPFTSMCSDVMIARRAKHSFAVRQNVEAHWRATCSRLRLDGISPGVQPPVPTQDLIMPLPLQGKEHTAGGNSSKHDGLMQVGQHTNLKSVKSVSVANRDVINALTTPLIIPCAIDSGALTCVPAFNPKTPTCCHGAVTDRSTPGDLSDTAENIVDMIAANLATECIRPTEVARRVRQCFVTCDADQILRDTRLEDATYLAANRTPGVNKKSAKRQGAKAVKKLERVSTSGDLSSAEATMSRALSARANYRAQDRPDRAFSTQ